MSVEIGALIVAGGKTARGDWALTLMVTEKDRKIAAALALQECDFKVVFRVKDKEVELNAEVKTFGLDKYGDWTMTIIVGPRFKANGAALSTMNGYVWTVTFTPIEAKEEMAPEVEPDMEDLF